MTNINELIGKYQSGKFEYEEKDRDFISLKDYAERIAYKFGEDFVTPIRAMYINTESQFGDAPVIYTDEFMINMPQHLTKLVTQLRQDNEIVEAVNAGQLGFTIYSYKGKNGNGYSINLTPYETENNGVSTSKGRAFDSH